MICLKQQYGQRFIVFEHEYSRRDKSQTLWSYDVLEVPAVCSPKHEN